MKSVLITGANRGLGLGMVKYLIKQQKAEKIFATCRNSSAELTQLAEENKNLHVLNLDVTNIPSYGEIASQISQVTGTHGLNLLINNAGISTKFTKLPLVKTEQLMDNLTINTVAPIMLTKTLLPLLKQAADANNSKPLCSERALVINMSSILGSIAKNDQGGFYPYRCSKELTQLAEENKNLHIFILDVTDFPRYGEIASKISQITGTHGLNLLINNAGILTESTKLDLVKTEELLDVLTVNTVAPIMLTKTLLPLLKQAADVNNSKPFGSERAMVINITSKLGSIADNQQGGHYPYRCSKAALNAATKSMSIDLKREGILVACIHPGWVQTDMGGKNAPLDIDTSISGILQTIEKLREKDTGKFLQYDGQELPW